MQFVIPFKMDSLDRYRNLEIVVEYIKSNFRYDILISEYDTKKRLDNNVLDVECIFTQSSDDIFNKSRCINIGVDYINTNDIVCICDSDVVFNIDSFIEGLKVIESGVDFCLPYDGPVYNISSSMFLDVGRILNNMPRNKLYSESSIGGIIIFNKHSFYESGKYNENFLGWGSEDYEFWLRINKLGFKIHRCNGCLYHLNHFRFHPSRNMNLVDNNRHELDKLKIMNKYQLLKYYALGD